MLSFKNNQSVQPLYDYYVETDLDSFDDQPVDYSKKYSDQEDSYDDCRRKKSILKTTEFPSAVSQTIKQSCNDEVKVYCIEGTPLTISYASSLSDLREIGTSSVEEKSDIKHTFPSVNDDDSPDLFDVDIKKDIESPDSKKGESPLLKEKDDVKEGKSVSFRNSTDISKASSPLMFSRSSSVGSLNSFEQQSIIDDRSSVSVFSALTSGLISPSDLPDSPGEIMSPALTDKDSSPKIDVTKLDSDNECDDIGLERIGKIDLEETLHNNTDNHALVHAQLPISKVCIPLDSSRNSEDEILAEQLELSNDSLDVDGVFDDPDYQEINSFTLRNEEDLRDQLSKSDDDDDSDCDDILLQQCIQLGMPGNPKEIKCDIKVNRKLEYPSHSQNVPTAQVCIPLDSSRNSEDEILAEQLELSNDSLDVDGVFDDPDYQENNSFTLKNEEVEMNKERVSLDRDLVSNDIKNALIYKRELELSKESLIKTGVSSTELELKISDTKSDDESDEDDELLKRCIQLGMPENTSSRIMTGSEGFMTRYSPHPVKYNPEKDFCNQACDKSDDDSDGEDDIILQKCIQLGMPSKLPENKISTHKYKMVENHTAPVKVNSSQVQLNSKSTFHHPHHSDRNNVMPLPSLQCRMPLKLNDKAVVNTKPVVVRQSSPIKTISKNIPGKMYPIKADVDSDDDDESDLLLQRCIQMGMPKECSVKKMNHPGAYRKPEFDNSVFNFHPINDMRNNCPDGIGAGDKDGPFLRKDIKAGMPNPKITSSMQSRLHAPQPGHICHKRQIVNHPPFMPEAGNDSVKKCNPVRLPQYQPYAPVHSSTSWISNTSVIDVDSMKIYRTEDTPILSPSASISDLSSLSFNESFLNNSRNSDCSSDSDDDDELLRRCIRSGMPQAKRAVA